MYVKAHSYSKTMVTTGQPNCTALSLANINIFSLPADSQLLAFNVA